MEINRRYRPVFYLLAMLFVVVDAHAREMPPAPVVVASADLRMLAPVMWVPGSVISRRDADVAAEISGRLTFVAEVGSVVKKGAVLAKIENRSLRLQLDEHKAGVDRARARLRFLSKEVNRLKRLASSNNAARTQLEQTEAERDVANGDLSLAGARLEQVREQLRRSEVRAPFGGMVASRMLESGEWVGNGEAILRLVDTTALEVKAGIPLNARRFVRSGTELQISSGSEQVAGKVRTLSMAGDTRSRLLDLRVALVGADWASGQTVRVGVPLDHAREVIAVPRDALVLRRSGTMVFRINAEGMAERIEVVTGIAQGDMIEIAGDRLQAGDQVVVRGSERLRPGQKVRIVSGSDS